MPDRRSSFALPRVVATSVLVGVLLAGCGGSGPSDGSSGSPGASANGAVGSAAPAATIEGANGSGGPSSCTPQPPTAMSSGWTTLQAHDHDYTFAYPSTWQSMYGAFVFDTSTLVSKATFDETGLPADATTLADLVRAPGLPLPGSASPSPVASTAPDAGLPNAEVLIIPGVRSSTDTVYARELARFTSVADIQIVSANLVGCLGGERALGVQFVFSAGTTFQESWYVVRNGRLYDFQWLAAKGSPQTSMFDEMTRTFTWTSGGATATTGPSGSGATGAGGSSTPAGSSAPGGGASGSAAPAGSGGSGGAAGSTASPGTGGSTAGTSAGAGSSAGSSAFVVAGMAASIVSGAAQADPSTFTKTLPKSLKAIYAVFVLQPGLTGTVRGELKDGAFTLATVSLNYGAGNTWGDFTFNSAKGFTPGTGYVLTLTHVPSGSTLRLPFTVK